MKNIDRILYVFAGDTGVPVRIYYRLVFENQTVPDGSRGAQIIRERKISCLQDTGDLVRRMYAITEKFSTSHRRRFFLHRSRSPTTGHGPRAPPRRRGVIVRRSSYALYIIILLYTYCTGEYTRIFIYLVRTRSYIYFMYVHTNVLVCVCTISRVLGGTRRIGREKKAMYINAYTRAST